MKKYKIVVTGFEEFGGLMYNPTKDLVKGYKEGLKIHGEDVLPLILPVEFKNAADILIKNIEENDPYIVLSSGLHMGARGVHIEKRGKNAVESYPDNRGYKPENGKIYEDGPEYLETGIGLETYNYLKEKGKKVILSDDAGAYVCNDLIYRTCFFLHEKGRDTKFGFLHIPLFTHYFEDEKFIGNVRELLLKYEEPANVEEGIKKLPRIDESEVKDIVEEIVRFNLR